MPAGVLSNSVIVSSLTVDAAHELEERSQGGHAPSFAVDDRENIPDCLRGNTGFTVFIPTAFVITILLSIIRR
jgi:hypothetical protein